MRIVRGAIINVILKRKTSSKKDVNKTFVFRLTTIVDKYYSKWHIREIEKGMSS